MNVRHLVHVVSLILLAVAIALTITAGIAALYGDGDTLVFVLSAVTVAAVGGVGYATTDLGRDLSIREGYAVVSFAWVAIGAAGALPYLFAGVVETPVAALFESISGFTTTGATVFGDIEALPHGILFWRSFTQWIGGMGIIVLGIAILPYLGVGGMQLFRAEVPGPTPERLQPRIAQTAKLLWYVYAVMTAVEVVLYLLGGMPLFEAVTHAFSTLSTGGFSPRADSLAAYDSAYIHYVTILFMFLAGVNFSLHYRALARRRAIYLDDPEFRFFVTVLIGATGAVAVLALASGVYGGTGIERVLRDALFQVTSIATTTGFVTFDYELWPLAAQLILVLLMFMGAMAGSTAGGAKAIRINIVLRHAMAQLRKSVHPRAVVITRVGRTAIREDVLLNVLAFLLFFFLLFTVGVLAMALLGHDLATSLGASAASIGNIGPGLGGVGAVDHYGWMSPGSHLVLMFLMLVGRLEIFTILLLFHPDLWRDARWR
ncbi:MAG TPA: TrkH family potassium uptake protein [Longimicrobiales bacterium]|nr:TrkH family potassium uptake protein [Longimicrobiales bacterium]